MNPGLVSVTIAEEEVTFLSTPRHRPRGKKKTRASLIADGTCCNVRDSASQGSRCLGITSLTHRQVMSTAAQSKEPEALAQKADRSFSRRGE